MKKRTIYITLFLIFIIGVISLIGTFAIDSSITEGNSTKADYLFNITLGDRTNREIVIPSYDSKIVDIKISNPNEFNMSYLLYLEGVNSNLSIINISNNEASGVLNTKTNTLIKVFIQNNSSSDITTSIKDIVGFENEKLSVPSNNTSINKGTYYKVIVKSNDNTYGKVKPNIKLSTSGGTVKYTLVPNTGYQYKSTTCNGAVSNNILTISNITSNTTCEVVFEPKQITVNFDLAGGGIETTYTEPKEHIYTVPYNGTYKLETWGAQGGTAVDNCNGGYGGYSVGTIGLSKNSKLYVNVGGSGTCNLSSSSKGGYNGGGDALSRDSYRMCSGGGATHISTTSGLLKLLSDSTDSILIVSGAGGGSGAIESNCNSKGGSGGGISGTVPQNNCSDCGTRTGGTQTSGGSSRFGTGGFGYGAGSSSTYSVGGGAGFYGGSGDTYEWGATGGSGYIGNSLLTNKYMYCYNCETSDATDTKTYTTTNTSSTPISNYAKSGNGAAKITLVDNANYKVTYNTKYSSLPTPTRTGYTFEGWYTGENGTGTKVTNDTILKNANTHTLYAKWAIKNVTVNFDLTGGEIETTYIEPKEHIYTVPYNGTYKLETWGAQGGTAVDNCNGGYGGYSVGTIGLSKNSKLYVNVGGSGTCNLSSSSKGGYNGGGDALSRDSYRMCSGGGATHISTTSGLLKLLSDSTDSILIVSGAGGGSGAIESNCNSKGGSGGGISGTVPQNNCSDCGTRTGGTQTSGGSSRFGTGGFGYGAGSSSTYSVGGGAGFYGGSGDTYEWGATGGSGYIGNSLLTNKYMYCYNCETSDATDTKTYTTTNTSSTPISNYAKSGNGAAKITLVDNANYKVTYNTKYSSLPTPTRTGYTFEGWYTGENGTGTKVTSDTLLTNEKDHTLYAHWIIKVYTITFNKNGGTGGTDSVSITHGTEKGNYPNITLPTMSGYTFAGYYDSASGGTQYYSSSGNSVRNWDKTSDTTLYAHWTISDTSAPTCSLSASGSNITASASDNVGLSYQGWDSSYSGTSITNKDISAGTHTYYVKDTSGNTNTCSISISGLVEKDIPYTETSAAYANYTTVYSGSCRCSKKVTGGTSYVEGYCNPSSGCSCPGGTSISSNSCIGTKKVTSYYCPGNGKVSGSTCIYTKYKITYVCPDGYSGVSGNSNYCYKY